MVVRSPGIEAVAPGGRLRGRPTAWARLAGGSLGGKACVCAARGPAGRSEWDAWRDAETVSTNDCRLLVVVLRCVVHSLDSTRPDARYHTPPYTATCRAPRRIYY